MRGWPELVAPPQEAGRVDADRRRARGPLPVGGLAGPEFARVAAGGFGDGGNSYAHSMAWFRGKLYVGTVRHLLCLLKSSQPPLPHFMNPWPVPYPDDIFSLDLRAQIWCYEPQSDVWERVHSSPVVVGPSGHEVPRDLGYRGMAVFQGTSDPAPSLYVTTVSSDSRGPGSHVLRSTDGLRFEAVSEPGLGDPNISSLRSLVSFEGRLYVSPTGNRQAWNVAPSAEVIGSRDPVSAPWERVSIPGFGDSSNESVFEMEHFGGYLYAGTFNSRSGYQVWKTKAEGEPPYSWTKVVGSGAYRGHLNEAATSMCAFGDALYVGSGIQNGGYDRTNRIGPAAGELIRIYPDDTWDLVVGTPRSTPDGAKAPLSGMGPGFDNFFNGYIWRMAAHDGWLYVGTMDTSVFLPYASRARLPPWLQRLIRQVGVYELVRYEGGFDLWRSRDGIRWTNVTRTGFGNPCNYGARTMVSSPCGLFVGAANPFGPEVAAQTVSGWTYVPNQRGGAEVWLGSQDRQGTDGYEGRTT